LKLSTFTGEADATALNTTATAAAHNNIDFFINPLVQSIRSRRGANLRPWKTARFCARFVPGVSGKLTSRKQM
jgi:hypothetical protein